MFKITPDDERGTHLRIEGRLTAEAIPDVLGLIARQGSVPVTIDLSGLTTADGECRAMLAGLRRRGHRMLNPSPYIARLLEEDPA